MGSNPPVTVAALVYRDPAWVSFLLEGLAWARNATPFRTLIVGNDAEPQVMDAGRVDVDHRNEPGMKRMARIYAAWNRAVAEAETELVCLLNDDMYVSDGWLDALVECHRDDDRALPTSLLVESGRIPSAMPEYVRDFGLTPETFDREAWRTHSDALRHARGANQPGRLYMPLLVEREAFLRAGGYPPGNPPGTTGDKDLFRRLAQAGYRHVTVPGSCVYHVQCGSAGGYYPDE